MNRLLIPLATVIIIIAATLMLVGCTQSAPTPAPTQAPPKQAEPTKAPAAAPTPTAAPTPAPPPTKAPEPTAVPKVAFPEKGKSITMIVPWAAGGSTDIGARLLAAGLEKELATSVQVLNKTGGSSQTGLTEFVRTKPDGYTIAFTNLPSTLTTYLDPEKKAIYSRKDFQPVALHVVDPGIVSVKADSPYKTLKDFVDAAKANPEKLKGGTTGIMSSAHIQTMLFERMAGVKLAAVHFDGDAQGLTALLGGHIDFYMGQVAAFMPQFKGGEVRILGIMDKEESKFLPGVKTLESQGFKLYADSSRIVSVPAGTSMEIVQVLSSAIKRVMDNEDHKKKLDEMGVAARYMDPAQTAAYWADYEARVKPLVDDLRKSGS